MVKKYAAKEKKSFISWKDSNDLARSFLLLVNYGIRHIFHQKLTTIQVALIPFSMIEMTLRKGKTLHRFSNHAYF